MRTYIDIRVLVNPFTTMPENRGEQLLPQLLQCMLALFVCLFLLALQAF